MIHAKQLRLSGMCGAALVFGTALVLMCAKGPAKQQNAPAIPVVSVSAGQMDVPLELRDIGTVEPYSTIAVTSRVGGELMRVGFSEGQDVFMGETLFQIDPSPFVASLAQAQATVSRDQVVLANAQADAGRYKDLIAKEFVTQQDYEAKMSAADEAKATVEADSAMVKNARLNLGFCTICAPMSGRTGNLLVQQGNQVAANGPNPLVIINRIVPIYVRFTVPGPQLPEILRQSQNEKLTVWAYVPPDSATRYDGVLTFVDNAVDEATATITLKATFPNVKKTLWPGQYVQVGLILGTLRNAVVVPVSALQTSQQGEFVYVVSSGDSAQLRGVTTKTRYKSMGVIDTGIRPGERVIIDGQLRVAPGTHVVENRKAMQGSAP